MSVNKVIILGRIGKKPVLKSTGSGIDVCSFSVATSERKKVGDTYEEQTEWHNVTAWRKTAENCAQYLDKGQLVYIEGKLTTQKWEKDGEKRSKTEIMIDKIDFLTRTDRSEGSEQPTAQEKYVDFEKQSLPSDFDDDSIPF